MSTREHPADLVMLAIAIAVGIWTAIDSYRPAPECAVPIPPTEIRSTEQRA